MTAAQPIAIYYEHPQWFRPLFAELERRGVPYEALRADQLIVDPARGLKGDYSLFLNRMSPSAWERQHGGPVFETVQLLRQLEARGVPVWNGSDAYGLDISKVCQAALLTRLGIHTPRSRAVFRPQHLPRAAEGLQFPLLVKPNMGGNGAGIQRFDNVDELRLAVELEAIQAGPDGVYLVQEYHTPRDQSIVRVETLEGRVLYAIRIHLGPQCTFSLCPADFNQTPADQAPTIRVEAFEPAPDVVKEVEAIVRGAKFDVGGVEYLDSERNGQRIYYDVNGLSNFVANAEQVVGFDPTARLVDALQRRIQSRRLDVAA